MTHLERQRRREAIAARVGAGESPQSVAADLDVSIHFVRDCCQQRGVRCSTSGARPSTLAVLARLWDESKTLDEIGRELGVTKQRAQQVYAAARAAGIPVPRRHRGNRSGAA